MKVRVLKTMIDIDTGEQKKVLQIIKRFCKAYGYLLRNVEDCGAYHECPGVSLLQLEIQYTDFGQYKAGFEAEYITSLLENCFYLQSNMKFDCSHQHIFETKWTSFNGVITVEEVLGEVPYEPKI